MRARAWCAVGALTFLLGLLVGAPAGREAWGAGERDRAVHAALADLIDMGPAAASEPGRVNARYAGSAADDFRQMISVASAHGLRVSEFTSSTAGSGPLYEVTWDVRLLSESGTAAEQVTNVAAALAALPATARVEEIVGDVAGAAVRWVTYHPR